MGRGRGVRAICEWLGRLHRLWRTLTLTLSQREGGTLSCAPSAVTDAGNGPPLMRRPSADAVAGNGGPLNWPPSADAVAGNKLRRLELSGAVAQSLWFYLGTGAGL